MKDAPLLRGGPALRLIALFGGLVLIGLAIVLMLRSGLGLPPWDVLHQGIARHTPLTLGSATIVLGLVIGGIAWAAGIPPGWGTVANALVIGSVVDVLSSVEAMDRLSEASELGRFVLMTTGIGLFGVGSAFYIGAGMGAGPRDSLMLAIAHRTGQRLGLVRGAIEVTVLVTGLLLGGTVGVGTLVMALLVGPLVELSFWTLMKLGLASSGRRAPEFGPLDIA